MLSILCVRLTIKVKVGIPESFKVGWYPPKKTGSSHLNHLILFYSLDVFIIFVYICLCILYIFNSPVQKEGNLPGFHIHTVCNLLFGHSSE